jgi:hypothetical protein
LNFQNDNNTYWQVLPRIQRFHTPNSLPVLFKFCPSATTIQKSSFLTAIKELKSLPSILDNRLIVGGPSATDPIEKSKGFDYALLSFHRDREALEEYQASKEHKEYDSSVYDGLEADETLNVES